MEEIVQEILQAEQQAGKKLEEARSRAAEIRARADARAADRVKDARTEAQKRIQERVTGTREQADRQMREALAATDAEHERFADEHPQALERAVLRVVEAVLRPEL